MTDERQPAERLGRSWLEERIGILDALYRRFGREGLKDRPLTEVSLLLAAKELAFRDAPKGRELGETQKETNRQLELEIKDLTGYVNGLLAGANMPTFRSVRHFVSPSLYEQSKPKQKERGFEPER